MLGKFMGNIDAIRRLAALLAALMILAIIYFATDVGRQLSSLATASSDNVQWALSQAEVEAKELETIAAVEDLEEEPDLTAVRTRYDILYSRYSTLRESSLYSGLREDPRVASAIENLSVFFDETIPIIDGPDPALRSFLPELSDAARAAHGEMRQVALAGIEVFSKLSDDRRNSVARTLFDIAVLSALLFLALVVLIFLLLSILERMEVTTRNLRETKDRMQTIVDNSLDAIVVADLDGHIVEFNRAAERIFGYSREAALGRPMGELIVPDPLRTGTGTGMADSAEGEDRRILGKGIVQLEARRASGEIFPVDVALATAEASDDRLIIGFMRDISQRLEGETELRDARDRAIAGEKSKAELLAVMSHEMRTPLNGMLGTLELIQPDRLDDETRRYLGIVRRSGDALLSHVNDVLEISRLDADKMLIDARPFDLVALMREVIDSQEGSARENGNRIELSIADPALHEVWGDESRTRQILFNLVGNAVKFTKEGTIALEAECEDGLESVMIRVIDSGIGIEDEDIDRIFEDFVTIDASYGRASGGTGLGLGISRRLAKALGGELGAESVPGEGSVFWLRLPLAPDHQMSVRPAGNDGMSQQVEDRAPTLPPLRILLVEDNPVNRLVAREMLERDGHTITEAHDGKEGVAAARESRYDLILMDISMPGLDGIEATAAIRADPAVDREIPIIATTAHALPDEISRFRDAGMTDILVKPLRRNDLRQTIAAAFGNIEHASADGHPADASETDLLDTEQVSALIGTLPADKIGALWNEFETELIALRQGIAEASGKDGNLDQLADAAHRTAGSAAVFGARRLNDLLRRTEAAARNRDPLEPFGTELESHWNETSAALENALLAGKTSDETSGTSVSI
jgi:PAS domain S-box-containing protein